MKNKAAGTADLILFLRRGQMNSAVMSRVKSSHATYDTTKAIQKNRTGE